MPKPRYRELEGRVFMIVTPVKKLFHSSLIHDVITSGRNFVVDMETGELTIKDFRQQ